MPASSIPQPQPAAEPLLQPRTQRSMLIDVARGLAISLVALGHTNQGVMRREWWGPSSVGLRLNTAVYAVHMPAFFFLSGVFLCAGLDKRGPRRFTLERLRTMIYPYVLWACIYALSDIVFARFIVQKAPTLPQFFANLVTGNTSWFLPTLFFAMMLAMLGRRLPILLLFALSALLQLFLPETHINFVDRGLMHLPFLVLGMAVGRRYESMEAVSRTLSALAAILLAVSIVVVTGLPIGASRFLFIPLGILGTLMLLLFARSLARTRPARAFAWAGEASFGIFLISAYFQGGGRELLLRLAHTTQPYAQLLFPTLLAIVIPAWLYQHRLRLHLGWMFVWPF